MSVFVVDASVVLKWFLPEVHSEAARKLLDASHQYVAPDLLFPEVGNAVWKKMRRGEVSREDAGVLVRDIAAIAVETIAARILFEDACAIALASGQTVYDATYLALAVRLETRLVTGDERLERTTAAIPELAEYICAVEAFPS